MTIKLTHTMANLATILFIFLPPACWFGVNFYGEGSSHLRHEPIHGFWEEGQQIRKSSKAIPAHIAEGYGRKRYITEYRRFTI